MLTVLQRKFSILKKHEGFRRYAANTSWMMVEQLLRIVAGLLVGIWVARYLGPEKFGLFSYVIAFSAIFGGIAKLGLDGIIVRELVNQPKMRLTYLGTAFWLKIIGAFLVLLLLAIVLPFTSNDNTTNLYIFIISGGLIFQSFEVVEFYFQSQVRSKIISICKVLQLALSSLIKIYLVLCQAELIWFVLVSAFDVLSLAISYFIAYKLKEKLGFLIFFNGKVAKNLLNDSWPLIFSSIAVMIYMRVDQIMIKEMMGMHDVGIYSAAIRISEAFYFIPGIVTASVLPAVINAQRRCGREYRKKIQILYSSLIWMAILISIMVTIFGESAIRLLYGNSYQDSSDVLILHIWGSVFVFMGIAFGKNLLVENRTLITLKRTILGVTINCVLNYLLIPIYGLKGAAFATIFSQAVANYAYDFVDPKIRVHGILKTKALFMPVVILTTRNKN